MSSRCILDNVRSEISHRYGKPYLKRTDCSKQVIGGASRLRLVVVLQKQNRKFESPMVHPELD